MFDRFTDRARKVMGLARQECHRLNHDYIGTEHILLGLLDEGSGVASCALKNISDIGKIRSAILSQITEGRTAVTMGQIPFTPRAKKVLELSFEEMGNLGHTYIGTEHLLLGLIREHEGVAARALAAAGVRVENVREEVLEILGVDAPEPVAFDPQEVEVIRKRVGGAAEEKRWLATYDELRKALEIKESAHKEAISRQLAAEAVVDRFLFALDGLRALRRLRP